MGSHLAEPHAPRSLASVTADVAWASAADFLLCGGNDTATALVSDTESVTHAQLRQAVARLEVALADAALSPGSRVGILGSNSFFWVAAYLASMRSHVAVPLSDKLPPEEIAEQARRVGCQVVFADRLSQRRLCSALDDSIVLMGEERLHSGASSSPSAPRVGSLDDDAVLLFTSGTTAAAKVVRLTHRNIIANTESIVAYLGLRDDDRMLVVLPFHYCYGLSLLNTHLRAGGGVVLCNSFVFPELAIDLLESKECTGIAGVPSHFQMLLRASTFASRPLPSLRLIQQAGGKLPPALVEELVAAQPHAQLFIMYGQTEATARLSYLPPELVLERPGSIGRGIPGVELRVVDEHDQPVAPGAIGEILARGENISPGYLADPVETAAKFPAGALRTGDLATVDEDGFIYIVDRKSDFIKSWGHRVSSQEVEAAVLRHPELISAAAFGVPDAEAGEAITLAVTLRTPSTLAAGDIQEFARSQLAKHKVPKRVFILAEIPLNANGKTDKQRLRELFRAASGTST